jgi:hypothetical protein
MHTEIPKNNFMIWLLTLVLLLEVGLGLDEPLQQQREDGGVMSVDERL